MPSLSKKKTKKKKNKEKHNDQFPCRKEGLAGTKDIAACSKYSAPSLYEPQ